MDISAQLPEPPTAKFAITRTIVSGVEPHTDSYAYPHLSQVTSYRTGDEGWQLANVWASIYGAQSARRAIIELSDFYTLETNNQFGNTLRFTDSSGTVANDPIVDQDIIYDNYLGIQIYFDVNGVGTSLAEDTWNNYIDGVRGYDDLSWYPLPSVIHKALNEINTSTANELNKYLGVPFNRQRSATSDPAAPTTNDVIAGPGMARGFFVARTKTTTSLTFCGYAYKLI